MTWSITAAGEIKNLGEKALEDLERELFDAVGPVLSRFGAFASNFAGHHITGAPHQTTSDAAAPTGAQPVTEPDSGEDTTAPGTGTGSLVTSGYDPAGADTGEDSAPVAGSAESDPDPAGAPAPSTPVDPPAADVPLPDTAPDTGAAATS